MRDEFQRVFREYAEARNNDFGGHELAAFIREQLPAAFRNATAAEFAEFVWHGSAGAGNWAVGPWLAAFDPAITTSAHRGFYPVFLFSSKLDAVYWSMNQGVTDLRKEFKTRVARQMLGHRANRLRARAEPDIPEHFRTDSIELHPPGSSHLLSFYEAGHAFGPRYSRDALPTDDELRVDVETMLRLYRLLAARGGTDDLEEEGDDTAAERSLIENRRYRYHRSLERSAVLANAAKKIHGYACQCCGFDFEAAYGKLGHAYIEAHHLVPIAAMDGEGPIPRDPRKDFSVLCSNCHRMIHRLIRAVDGPVRIEELLSLMSRGPAS